MITPVRADLEAFLEAAVRGGVDLVQVREKRLADGELLPALERARELTRRLGVPLAVNDRPDLAALVEADFVHVGQDDLPVEAARRLGLATPYALVERNGEPVERERYPVVRLHEGDSIVVARPVAGG